MVDWQPLLRLVVIPAAQSLIRGRPIAACRFAVLNGHALVRDRLWPNERLAFAGKRDDVRVRRDSLYLQSDHAAHLARYRRAIAADSRHRKGAFAKFCLAADLPHPPTVVLDTVRRSEQLAEVERMSASSLFVKADAGSNARGAAALDRLDDDRWQIRSRAGVAQGPLTVLLDRHCPGEAMVVQPRLENGAALAEWAGPSLVTFRIVTGRRVDGDIEMLSMLAELPLDAGEPLARRWCIAPVSPSDDRLRVMSCEARLEKVSGRAIEFAPTLRNLAIRAHSLLADTASSALPSMIGWDVAWTDDGAIVLEYNWNWAIAPHYSNSAGVDFRLAPIFRRYASA